MVLQFYRLYYLGENRILENENKIQLDEILRLINVERFFGEQRLEIINQRINKYDKKKSKNFENSIN